MYKKVVSPTETTREFYLQDIMGRTVAIRKLVNDAPAGWEYYVNGTEREAKLNISSHNGMITASEIDFYLHDHLGNTRVVYEPTYEVTLDLHLKINYVADYFPYGKILKEYVNAGDAEKFLTTQHERDQETGLDYRGARYYDADIARFLSVDPWATKYPEWSTYNYVMGNPIMLIDPTGKGPEWKPDSDGNLIAEKGDNAQTLANFLGISFSDGLSLLKEQGYTVNSKGILNLKIGDKVELNNVFTESIRNSTSEYTTDVMMKLKSASSGSGPGITRGTLEDDYNCWGAACAGSQGKKIDNKVGIPSPNTFDDILTDEYSSTTSASAVFGKTVLRFSNGENIAQHGAVSYGKSQDGTEYVYTKNGWHAKPEVMKLSDLLIKIPSYGTVKGITAGESGYYNPKP